MENYCQIEHWEKAINWSIIKVQQVKKSDQKQVQRENKQAIKMLVKKNTIIIIEK